MAATTRRQFLKNLLAGSVASCSFGAVTTAATHTYANITITDYGATGDGLNDDRDAIVAAIRQASQYPGSQILLPRGVYRLKHIPGGELLSLKGTRDLRLRGENARLLCDTPGGTTSVFKLTDCENINGLNFQNNGDNVLATGIRCDDVKRSYFPYGVANHRIELAADNNATGFTDVLIKCYGRETSDLAVKLRSRGKRSGDAIVAFDQQHPDDLGMIRDVRIDLDVADADCRLNNIILMRAFTPDGKVMPKTRSQWRNLQLLGQAHYCNSSTRLLTVDSAPRDPGTIAMSEALSKQVDKGQVGGFRLTLAGVPDRRGPP